MTRAIGYDYGTTTSWVAVIDDMNMTPVLRSRTSSVFIKNNGQEICCGDDVWVLQDRNGDYIKSPKHFLLQLSWEQFEEKYRCSLDNVIQTYTESILDQEFKKYQSDDLIHVTLTIPNCYNGTQLNYIRKCVSKVLDYKKINYKLHLLPEPVSAALYYAVSTDIEGCNSANKYIVVCDIGGGTTDLSIIFLHREKLEHSKEVILDFEVVATEYDGKLGGDNIDELVYKRALSTIQHTSGENPDKQLADRIKTRYNIIDIKESLSSTEDVNYELVLRDGVKQNFFMQRFTLEADLSTENSFCTRLRSKIQSLKRKMEDYYRQTQNGDFDWSQVLLLPIGGSMRIPRLRQEFQEAFPYAMMYDIVNEQRETYDSVVYGAMYYSAIVGNLYNDVIKEVCIKGRTRHAISVEYLNNRLFPIVQEDMPDGEYNTDKLFPLECNQEGIFHICSLRLFLTDDTIVVPGLKADFEMKVNSDFYTHGSALKDIHITITVTIKNSEIVATKILIPNGNEDGTNYTRFYTKEDIQI